MEFDPENDDLPDPFEAWGPFLGDQAPGGQDHALPAAWPLDPPSGEENQPRTEGTLRGTLFILDGDPVTAELARQLRSRFRCDLRVLSAGRDLLEAVSAQRPAAIILGERSRDLSPPAILAELRKRTAGSTPPPVALLSNDNDVLMSFDVLTYPGLATPGRTQNADVLLKALEPWVRVERAPASRGGRRASGLPRAREVQQKLLPASLPHVSRLDIAVHYQPYEEVGGDYYDFIPLRDGRIDVVCADVSGKGVAAALVMVMFRALLRLTARRGVPPAEVLRVTNQHIANDLIRGMFVTALYVRLDPWTRRATVVNAGHLPLLLRPASQPHSVVHLGTAGMAVGIAGNTRFMRNTRSGEFQLSAGDLLCFYTDGVVEAENSAGEQFGVERLKHALAAAGKASAREVTSRIRAAVAAFANGAEPRDDTTIVVLKLLGP